MEQTTTQWAFGTIDDFRKLPALCKQMTDQGWTVHTVLPVTSALGSTLFGVLALQVVPMPPAEPSNTPDDRYMD